jgi:hypothetical protein
MGGRDGRYRLTLRVPSEDIETPGVEQPHRFTGHPSSFGALGHVLGRVVQHEPVLRAEQLVAAA